MPWPPNAYAKFPNEMRIERAVTAPKVGPGAQFHAATHVTSPMKSATDSVRTTMAGITAQRDAWNVGICITGTEMAHTINSHAHWQILEPGSNCPKNCATYII